MIPVSIGYCNDLFFFISRFYTSPGPKAHNSSQQHGNAVSRIWSLTQRAVRQSTTRTSKPSGVSLKFILAPALLTVSGRLFCHVAYCEADVNNNSPVEAVTKNPVPEFKWHILWEFVKPQLFALMCAVVVSLNQFTSNTMAVFCWQKAMWHLEHCGGNHA